MQVTSGTGTLDPDSLVVSDHDGAAWKLSVALFVDKICAMDTTSTLEKLRKYGDHKVLFVLFVSCSREPALLAAIEDDVVDDYLTEGMKEDWRAVVDANFHLAPVFDRNHDYTFFNAVFWDPTRTVHDRVVIATSETDSPSCEAKMICSVGATTDDHKGLRLAIVVCNHALRRYFPAGEPSSQDVKVICVDGPFIYALLRSAYKRGLCLATMLVPVVMEKFKFVGATRRVQGTNQRLYLADAPFRKKKPIYTKDEKAPTTTAMDSKAPGPQADATATEVNSTATEVDTTATEGNSTANVTDDDSRPNCADDIGSKVDLLVDHMVRADLTHTAQYKALDVTVSLRDKAHEVDLKARSLEGQQHGMKERKTLFQVAQDRESLLLAAQERNGQLERENEELKIRIAQTEKMLLEGLQKMRDNATTRAQRELDGLRATIASFANVGRSFHDLPATSRAQVPLLNIQASSPGRGFAFSPNSSPAQARRSQENTPRGKRPVSLTRESEQPSKRPSTMHEKGNNTTHGDDVKASTSDESNSLLSKSLAMRDSSLVLAFTSSPCVVLLPFSCIVDGRLDGCSDSRVKETGRLPRGVFSYEFEE